MSNPKIVCVTPSNRPDQMVKFREAWAPLFDRHGVTLVTVWDGDTPDIEIETRFAKARDCFSGKTVDLSSYFGDLFCRRTDAVRNAGFAVAAVTDADFVLTLDDDVAPMTDPAMHPSGWEVYGGRRINDPIQAHLDALARRVPVSWMNTAHMDAEYLRGVPYGVRDEAPVMLSHGVWVGVPDFDGETQLRLEQCSRCDGDGKAHGSDRPFESSGPGTYPGPCPVCNGTGKNPTGVPRTLPYYVGPIPRGALWACCGMNLMVRREALPYLYFAPMGADAGVPDLHRFADIFMGVYLKQEFTRRGWAIYTGASTILHTRASDAAKNFEQERLGRQWNEVLWKLEAGEPTTEPIPPGLYDYWESWKDKRRRFADLIRGIQEGKS